jgi:hypothetical protein
VAAVALGGFLLGAAVLTTGTASAEQVDGAGRQVVFSGGGVFGLSCGSNPSVGSLAVPKDGTVRVVNRTGHRAKLLLNGAVRGSVPRGHVTEVAFRHGTTKVSLDPECVPAEPAAPVLVGTTPPTPPESGPTPEPTGAEVSETPAAPPGSGTPPTTAGGPPGPDAGPPAGQTQRPSSAPGRPPVVRPHPARGRDVAAQVANTAAQAMPQGGAALRIRNRAAREGAAPVFSGMPIGEDQTILHGVSDLDPDASEAVPAGPSSQAVAAEPVAASRPLPQSRSGGLLALVAAVCVIGVAVGVIRALVSQRAYRANLA